MVNNQNGNNGTDPTVNDVLAQQMGTEYADVNNRDKEDLQKDLKDQSTKPEDLETEIPSDGVVDDRNTSDGQVIGT